MRVLILTDIPAIARVAQLALAPLQTVHVSVGSISAVEAASEADVVVVSDEEDLSPLFAGATEHSWLFSAVVLQRTRRDSNNGGAFPPTDSRAATTSAWPLTLRRLVVALAGEESPSELELAEIRQAVLQFVLFSVAERQVRLGHQLAESKIQLEALAAQSNAGTFSVDLLPDQGGAAVYAWLRATSSDPRYGGQRVHPADEARVRESVEAYLRGAAKSLALEFRVLGQCGQWEWIRQQAVVASRYDDGSPRRVFVTQTAITSLKRAESLLAEQARIFSRVLAGDELKDVLSQLTMAIEENYAGAQAVVARLDEEQGRLYHLAGPSLPDEYHAALEGLPIGPNMGACGAAAFEGRRVIIPDLHEDPGCRDYLPLFQKFGLRSVWSQPIVGSEGNVLGTFAIYHREPHSPDADETQLIENAANLAGLAIERWRQVEDLRRSEEHFRHFTERARFVPWEYDTAREVFTYVGPQVESIVGYPAQVWKEPSFWRRAIHPDDVAAVASFVDHPEQFGEHFEFQFRMLHPQGGWLWMQSFVATVLRDGKVVGLRGFTIDITDRKRVNDALRESEERYRILADHSTDLITRHDATGTIDYASPSCRTLLGYASHDLVGRPVFDFVHPDDVAAMRRQWQKLQSERSAVFTQRLRHADGHFLWFEGSARLRAAGENPQDVIATWRDITERVENARRLREREAQLAHAERLSTMGQMAAELAHEINQPLQAISNFAEAAQHWAQNPSDNTEPLRRWTANIGSQARRAGEVIKRISNFVRKGELDPESIDLTDCVQQLRPLLDLAARNSGVTIDYQLADELPQVTADRLLVEQIIVNLIRNALEASTNQPTERRLVTVRTFTKGTDYVAFAVEDRGHGLIETTERLFEPYFTTKPDGTGMGLAICRSTIDAHQGQIEAEPNEHGGASFWFALPVRSHFSAQIVRR